MNDVHASCLPPSDARRPQEPLTSVRLLRGVCLAALLWTAPLAAAIAAVPAPRTVGTSTAQPEAVVKQLYAIWLRPGHPPRLEAVKRQLSRRFYAEIDRGFRLRQIDVDPITENQGNTLDAKVYPARHLDRTGAVVVPVCLHVGFSPPGHPAWLDVKVVHEHGEWRVDNITEGTASPPVRR